MKRPKSEGEGSIVPRADTPKAPAETEYSGITGQAPVTGSSSAPYADSLGPTTLHTQGTPGVGPPREEGYSNSKARIGSCTAYEHSLLAAEVGDEVVVS